MIGGVVIETIVLPDKVWINCEEEQSSTQCAIYVERSDNAETVKVADSVWWQGGYALWTPFKNKRKTCDHQHHYSCKKVGVDYDIRLKRIGFSGVNRPEL